MSIKKLQTSAHEKNLKDLEKSSQKVADLSKSIAQSIRYENIEEYCLPASELEKKQEAIYVTENSLETVKQYLDAASNDGQKIIYEIEEKDGVKHIITHLWGGVQDTPVDGSYCFLTNAGDTYPIRKAEFDQTYNITAQAEGSPIMETQKAQKIIKPLEIVPGLAEDIEALLANSTYDKTKYDKAGYIDRTTKPWTLVINTLEGVQKLPFYEANGQDPTSKEELAKRKVLIQGVSGELYHNTAKKFLATYVSVNSPEAQTQTVKQPTGRKH